MGVPTLARIASRRRLGITRKSSSRLPARPAAWFDRPERLARYRIGADQSADIAGVLQRQTCRAPYPTPRHGISTDDRTICRLDYGTRYGFGLAHLLALKLSTV